MTLLRQWPLLESVFMPSLMMVKPLERTVAWNLGCIDDALAVTFLLLHCITESGRDKVHVFHSGSPPAFRPVEWGPADIRGMPRHQWVRTAGGRRGRWSPRGEVMERVLLGEPPSTVHVISVGDLSELTEGSELPLRRLVRDGHVLSAQPSRCRRLPAGLRQLDADGRIFRKVTDADPTDAMAEAGATRSLLDQQGECALVTSHMNLARALARRFQNRGENLDDLQQVAVLALVKAAGRYDARKGAFASFATTCILGELKRHFRDRMWMVRVPRSVQELHLASRAARDELTQILGTSPTVGQIAEHLGSSEEAVLSSMEAAQNCWPTSLDAPTREGDENVTEVPVDDPGFEAGLDLRQLRDALPALGPTEQMLIRRIYFDGWTQRRVAEELSVSQMQVSRLVSSVLERLRRSLESG